MRQAGAAVRFIDEMSSDLQAKRFSRQLAPEKGACDVEPPSTTRAGRMRVGASRKAKKA
jgi:hypothetical protein